jgi:hypothetical protein
MCEEYEFDWHEQARIAEKQRRERQRADEQQPSKSPAAKPEKPVKDKEPVPA